MKLLSAILLFFLMITPLHSGRTDANGGHYDRSTGEYHYHHGYPAHQHPNGICPYEQKTTARSLPVEEESEDESKINPGQIVLIFFGVVVLGSFFVSFVSKVILKKTHLQDDSPSDNRFPNNSPSLPPPSSTELSPKTKLNEREKEICFAIARILKQYISFTDYQKSVFLPQCIHTSFQKIKDDPDASSETMARRILSRSCFSFLSYLHENNISDENDRLNNILIFDMLQDCMLWLLRTGYYSRERYDLLVNTMNVTITKMNLKRESSSANNQ